MLARLHEHVGSGYNIGDGRLSGIVSREPDGDRNIVGRISEGDREETVDTEKQLSPSVVVS